jgi:tetratricopeptide (TPR) repeat protein
MLLVTACLLAGIAGGWMIRTWHGVGQAARPSASASTVSRAAAPGALAAGRPTDPARLKAVADADAAPLLVQLQSSPASPDLLTSLGNLYYDAQQYPTAIDYYTRALQGRPADAAVRTDLGTALWFEGNADAALTEFGKALADSPNNPNTLFNRGLVKWQGKHDDPGALADWKLLLQANPNYPGRDKVTQLIAQVEKQAAPARD